MTSRIFHFSFFEKDLQTTSKFKKKIIFFFARQTIANKAKSFFKRDFFYSFDQNQFYTIFFENNFEKISSSLKKFVFSKKISSNKSKFELNLFKSIIFNSSNSILFTMISVKIRFFKKLRNEKKNSKKYIENINWTYERNFKTIDVDEITINKFKRMLFRQNLKNDVHVWYKNLKSNFKQNWSKLLKFFLKYYEIFVKNAQTKKFELKMQLTQLKQKNQKLIFDYIKRASNISRKLSNDEIDVEMIILRNMKNVSKRKQINFEYQKEQNYNFIAVNKLIRTIYNEINKLNSFDSKYKKIMQMMLFHTTNFDQINDELLKQILINNNQIFSTMFQTLRSLNFNFDQFTNFDQRKFTNTQQNDKNFAHIICYICKQSNHYVLHCSNQSNQTFRITKVINHAVISINQIQFQRQTKYSFASNQSFFSSELTRLSVIFNQSFHSQAVNKSQHEFRSTMSNVVTLASSLSILKRIKMKNYHIDDENNDRNFFSSMICILSTQKSYLITIMIAQNAKNKQKTNQTTTTSFFEIKKSKFRLNSSIKISKKSVKYVFNAKNQNDDEKNKKNQKSKKMNISRNEIDNDEFTFIYQSTSQSIFWKNNRSFFSQLFQSISQNSIQYEFRNSSSIKLNKKENLTHLISYKLSKIFDFIRDLFEINRFNVNIIMNLFLILSLKQFLDKFDVIKLKLTKSMQKFIAKYRVRKTNEQNRNQ